MAEALGVASGVLQVAEIGFSLATTLYQYARSAKDAEKDIKKVARDVRLTSKVLERTHKQMQSDQQAQLCTEEAFHDFEDVLFGCKEAFEEVDNALKKSFRTDPRGNVTIALTEKLKWPLRTNKLDVLRANLERLKTTLLLMLSVLAYGNKISQSHTRMGASLEKLQIENLVKTREEATQRYEELSKAFSQLEARIDEKAGVIPCVISKSMPFTMMTNFAHSTAEPPALTLANHFPKDSHPISAALGQSVSAVARLAVTIESATRHWEDSRVVQHVGIEQALHETGDSINVLLRNGLDHFSKMSKQHTGFLFTNCGQPREAKSPENRKVIRSHVTAVCHGRTQAVCSDSPTVEDEKGSSPGEINVPTGYTGIIHRSPQERHSTPDDGSQSSLQREGIRGDSDSAATSALNSKGDLSSIDTLSTNSGTWSNTDRPPANQDQSMGFTFVDARMDLDFPLSVEGDFLCKADSNSFLDGFQEDAIKSKLILNNEKDFDTYAPETRKRPRMKVNVGSTMTQESGNVRQYKKGLPITSASPQGLDTLKKAEQRDREEIEPIEERVLGIRSFRAMLTRRVPTVRALKKHEKKRNEMPLPIVQATHSVTKENDELSVVLPITGRKRKKLKAESRDEDVEDVETLAEGPEYVFADEEDTEDGYYEDVVADLVRRWTKAAA